MTPWGRAQLDRLDRKVDEAARDAELLNDGYQGEAMPPHVAWAFAHCVRICEDAPLVRERILRLDALRD